MDANLGAQLLLFCCHGAVRKAELRRGKDVAHALGKAKISNSAFVLRRHSMVWSPVAGLSDEEIEHATDRAQQHCSRKRAVPNTARSPKKKKLKSDLVLAAATLSDEGSDDGDFEPPASAPAGKPPQSKPKKKRILTTVPELARRLCRCGRVRKKKSRGMSCFQNFDQQDLEHVRLSFQKLHKVDQDQLATRHCLETSMLRLRLQRAV